MKLFKKLTVLFLAVLIFIAVFTAQAAATTLIPVFTIQPVITQLFPLPTASPTPAYPDVTQFVPIPTYTFEFEIYPLPVQVFTTWTEVNDDPIYYPMDVVADRYFVKILDWENGGRLEVLDIAEDTWYYLEPPASLGAMAYPMGMCEDGEGGVYIADTYNSRVLHCTQQGSWTVILDTDLLYPAAVLYYNETLYVADTGNDRIMYLKDGSWDEIDKVGTSTTFSVLTDIKVKNGGGLLIADGGNDYIINRAAASKMYSIIEDATYTENYIKMYPDANNEIYITTTSNDTLVKFDGSDFEVIMEYGTDIGEVNNPGGVFDDGLGTVYVADTGNSRVQRNKSSESSLMDLFINSVTIDGFDPDTTEYELTFSESESSVTILGVATSPYADVTGDVGSFALSYGENVFYITVDPEWGVDSVYTITITREESATATATAAPAETTSPTEEEAVSPTESAGEETTQPPEEDSAEATPETTEALGTLPTEASPSGEASNSDAASDESSSETEKYRMPTWLVIIVTVLICAGVAVAAMIIYISVKNKKPEGGKEEDNSDKTEE